MSDRHITVEAAHASPFIHVDERALVLCDGQHTVVFDTPRLRFASETLDVITAEGRATRTQHAFTFGGYTTPGGAVILYAASERSAVSLSVERRALETVRATLPSSRA